MAFDRKAWRKARYEKHKDEEKAGCRQYYADHLEARREQMRWYSYLRYWKAKENEKK